MRAVSQVFVPPFPLLTAQPMATDLSLLASEAEVRRLSAVFGWDTSQCDS